MSVEVWSLALNAKIDSSSMKAVLLGLANHASPEGKQVRPSVKRLCIYTSLSEKTVRRKLAELRRAGIIKVVAEAYRYRPTEYEINMEKLKTMKHPDLQLLGVSLKPPTTRGVSVTPLSTREVTLSSQGCHSVPSGGSPTQGEPSLTVNEPLPDLVNVKDSFLSDSEDFSNLPEDPWNRALVAIGATYYPKKMYVRNSNWNRYWIMTRYGSVENGKFIVLCDTEKQRAWLEDRGKKIAESSLAAILDEDVEVEFVVRDG